MDSETLFIVLDNDRSAFDTIRYLTHHSVAHVDADPDKEVPGAYYAAIGEAVADYLTEVGENEVSEDGLAFNLFITMVMHLDRYEIGKHYYQTFINEDA